MKHIASEDAVFSARTGLRGRLVHAVSYMSAVLVLAVSLQFSFELFSVRKMVPVSGRQITGFPMTGGAFSVEPSAAPAPQWIYDTDTKATCGPLKSASSRRITAFLPANDPAARTAVMQRCDRIDLLFEEAYTVTDVGASIELRSSAPIAGLGDRTLPVLQVSSQLDDAAAANIFSDPATLSGLAFRLDLLAEGPRAGLCLDLSARPEFSASVIETTIRVLVPEGQRCLIGAADAVFWNDRSLVDTLDLAVVQGFQTPTSPATPPASTQWFSDSMDRVSRLIPLEKLVIGLGTRGQIWRSGAYGIASVSFVEAMATTAAAEAPVSYVPWANALRSRFVDADGTLTEIWATDGLGIHNQLEQIGPETAIAVWPIGDEDPAIWNLLEARQSAKDILTAPINLENVVQIKGEGIIVAAAEPLVSGARSITLSDDGTTILSETYDVLPQPARLVRSGQQSAAIILSFADLPPDDIWQKLSRILDENGVEATFLVQPRDLIDRAHVARDIVATGHTLGLKQPNSQSAAPLFAQIAEKARQLLVADRTGVRARFVEIDETGDWSGFVRNAQLLLQAGYVPLAPFSPDGSNAPGAATEDMRTSWLSWSRGNNRIAVHAGPQDWDGVLADLSPLLTILRNQGYQFRSVREAAGLTHDQAMPVAVGQRHQAADIVFAVVKFMQNELNVIFFWFLIYSAVRSLIYLALAIVRRPKREFNSNWTPPVTVLIPAFNEEKVIESCIHSILGSPYPDLHIIVIDDGSTDATYDVVTKAFGADPRVTVLRQANAGKWAAANHGLEEMETPFFLVADADSVFTPETIGWLVQQFQDDAVGAVAGIVEVGNRRTFLGKCQALEYIVSQSIIRRAQEVFDGILVVPGAVGAWRTEAVRKAGLFSGNTVTEDADLTVAVHRAGYRVVFQEQARSVTEAPSSVRDFMRQRLRWTFGMLQTSWKHRGTIAEGRTVGYISIIDAIWFGVFSSLFAPLVDLLLVLLLLQGGWAIFSGDVALITSVPPALILAYFALTALDVLNTLVAFRFEGRFDWKLLLLVPVLRFGYRQLLYISTIRALFQATAGTVTGWNKLKRTGSVLSLWSR